MIKGRGVLLCAALTAAILRATCHGNLLLQVQWLPHSVRVSSVTREGLAGLQQAVLDLMQSEGWAAQVDNMRNRDSAALNDGEEELVPQVQLNS